METPNTGRSAENRGRFKTAQKSNAKGGVSPFWEAIREIGSSAPRLIDVMAQDRFPRDHLLYE